MDGMGIESSVHAQVAASLMPRLNSNLCLPLVERCGGIEGFFRETAQPLEAVCREFHVDPGLFDRGRALEDARRELEKMDLYGIGLCTIEEGRYPALLKECEDVPLVLYYKGDFSVPAEERCLAVVGTRRASARCCGRVEDVLGELYGMGHRPVVVSGLAYGIDAAAHRASLKLGLRTFAVLGHGLHMIYPAAHKGLADGILASAGALVSEFPCIAGTHPSNFLKRNRIVAGLCQATLVAESAVKGGAMSTARVALAYNRDVMAFPGRPDDVYSAGCNRLIKDNVAALVEDGKDVARILGYPERETEVRQLKLDLFGEDAQGEAVVARLRESGELHIDELARACGITDGSLPALLLQLELEGRVAALPGQRFAAKG